MARDGVRLRGEHGADASCPPAAEADLPEDPAAAAALRGGAPGAPGDPRRRRRGPGRRTRTAWPGWCHSPEELLGGDRPRAGARRGAGAYPGLTSERPRGEPRPHPGRLYGRGRDGPVRPAPDAENRGESSSLSSVRIGGRRSAILPTLVIAAVLVVLFAIFTSVWTDRLWYRSFDFGSVFTTMLLTRIGLFAGLRPGDGRPASPPAPPSPTGSGPRFRAAAPTQPAAGALPRGRSRPASSGSSSRSASSLGLFAGGAASGQVLHLPRLAQRHRRSASTDPQVRARHRLLRLRLPLVALRPVLRCSPRSAVSAVAAAVMHYVMGGAALQRRRAAAAAAAAQAQLSILVGLAILVRGVSYWFDRYGLEIQNQQLLTGINYTADNATVTAKAILAVIAGICALLFFANAVLRRWVVPTIGLVLMVLSAIVLGVRLPRRRAVLQRPPERADARAALHRAEHRRPPARRTASTDVEITSYSAEDHGDRRPAALRRRGAARHPADRPERRRPGLRAAAAGPRLLRRSPRPSTSTATPSTAPRPTPSSASAS